MADRIQATQVDYETNTLALTLKQTIPRKVGVTQISLYKHFQAKCLVTLAYTQ